MTLLRLETVIPTVGVALEPLSDEHPMRQLTSEVAADPANWSPGRAERVTELFDALAPDWHLKDVAGRTEALVDALDRGEVGGGCCLEVGAGTGIGTRHLAEAFDRVTALDLSGEMLARLPRAVAHRVRADASRLPLPDASVDAVGLVNALLFPLEVDRVLKPAGVVIWVNTLGAATPIHLPAAEVAVALPGAWTGVHADAGVGTWCVLRRA